MMTRFDRRSAARLDRLYVDEALVPYAAVPAVRGVSKSMAREVEDGRRVTASSDVGSTRFTAVRLSMSFSATMSTAILTAADAVRFPLRVWSM